jgi:hypothetical protein
VVESATVSSLPAKGATKCTAITGEIFCGVGEPLIRLGRGSLDCRESLPKERCAGPEERSIEFGL